MAEHEDFYTPEHIDEQVDALLQAFNMPDQDLHMAHDLRIVLTNADAETDTHSLQRVLHQLLEDKHSTHRQSDERILSLERIQQQKHGRILRMKITHEPAKKIRPVARVFSILAATLVVAALVGSMLILSHIIHQNGNTTTSSANTLSGATHPQASLPQGIYTSSNKAVFRLASKKLPQVIWQQALPGVSKIIPAGNVVYILQSRTSSTNAVLKLDASTGKILWKHAFAQPKNASLSAQITDMVLAQNRLYVNWAITTNMSHPGGDMIYVLNALTGGQVFVYTKALAQTWDAMDANDGIFAVGNTNLQVYNATTNKLLWQASMTGGNTNGTVLTLKIVNNLVYAIFSNNNEEGGYGKSYIIAYQAATGKKVWQSPIFPGGTLYHFAVDQNRVYFGIIDTANQPFTGRVYAYNIQSNKQLWSTPVTGGAQEPFAVSNSTIYTAVDPGAPANSHLIALNAATGVIKWQHTLDMVVLNSFCISNGILYTGRYTSLNASNPAMSIEAFNAAGQKLWESTQYGSSNIVPTE